MADADAADLEAFLGRRITRRFEEKELPSVKREVHEAHKVLCNGGRDAHDGTVEAELVDLANHGTQTRIMAIAIAVLVLVAIFFALYKFNEESPGAELEDDPCRAYAEAQLPSTMRKISKSLDGIDDKSDEDLVSRLRKFAKGLLVDHRVADGTDFPPRRAMSLRLQSNNQVAINKVFDRFLDEIFGAKCRKDCVLEIDVAASGDENLVTLVNTFLAKRKGDATPNHLALVVFRNVADKETVQSVMSFKDHLDQPEIPVSGAEGVAEDNVSYKGTGFVFLGGSLPQGEDCVSTSIEDHDTELKWLNNMQGRISDRARLCVPS
ncbi:Hypothetical Protein FCC1311_050772 [Hondaea fermentalgiana]|uniref:Uncharacterized protein n=1 Tax=Hondaea fermentalgiana TaxID=2315210 RepID=A0A2R5GD07_9STRA|nr:Hypothetical Protein FCC1311_050772 [Hondaea fermentalgiana]|eukprot:GBG28856.1 Hypothetical Protein FCC1311_050772 [Hondaea fermentalgiana]